MPKIKTTTDGGGTVRVITKAGKPSCTCCFGCSCSESLPDTFTVSTGTGFEWDGVVTRSAPCVWTGGASGDYDFAQLICFETQWLLRFYYGPIIDDVFDTNIKDDPTTNSPVGSYFDGSHIVS